MDVQFMSDGRQTEDVWHRSVRRLSNFCGASVRSSISSIDCLIDCYVITRVSSIDCFGQLTKFVDIAKVEAADSPPAFPRWLEDSSKS